MTSAQYNRVLICTALVHTDVSYSVLRDITNSEVSESTIHRRLQEDHIRKWKVAERALLMEEHAKKRLKWVREHRDCTQGYWNGVIFSGECAVQKDSDGRTVWVFRYRNKLEKYDHKNIRGQAKGGGLFQMIWGCFAGAKLGPIVFVNGTVNSDV